MAGTVARRLTRSKRPVAPPPHTLATVHSSGWPRRAVRGPPARRLGQGRHRQDDGGRGAGAGAGHRRPPHAAGRGGGPPGHRAAVRHRRPCPTRSGGSPSRPAAARCGRWPSTRGGAAGVPRDVLPARRGRAGRCAGWGPSSSPPRWPPACATCCSPARPRSASTARTAPGRPRLRRRRPRRPADRPGRQLPRRHAGDGRPRAQRPDPQPERGRGEGAALAATAVHLVTLLEDLPVTETLETRRRAARRGPAAGRGDRQPGAAAVAAGPFGGRGRERPGGRRAHPLRAGRRPGVDAAARDDRRAGRRDRRARRARRRPRPLALARLRGEAARCWSCRTWSSGVDLGPLYELAEALVRPGRRAAA